MNNPFFGAMGGGNSFMQMVQQFKQFKATQKQRLKSFCRAAN